MNRAELPTTAPPELPEGGLRVVALGGIGEIGRNMTVFEYDGRLLVVDCGVLFPAEDAPGVDLILPDFRAIEGRLDDIDAIVLTHGHEDHIGAVPFLLRQRPDLTVVGSRFTLALVAAKCKEHRLTPHLLEVKEGSRLRHGSWDCEYFAVNHSIPDALAVAIRTPAGLVLHTGDIKLDQLPLDGRLTDLAGFSRLGDEGVDLFLVDSTNADQPGFVISEGEIGPVLDGMFHRAGARIIVACFASHVHRVQQVLDAAAAHGRQVCFVGRSMVRNMGLAAEMGYLTVPPGLLVEPDDAAMIPDNRIVYVSTGSQGEPLSALARMASGDHRSVRIKPEDTVILASSLIPGNETAVFAVINGLTRLGAQVVHQGTARVHVSGHAPAGELLYLYNAVRPSNVMPVHGEWRHLRANAALAVKTGVPEDAVVLAEDGVVVDLVDGKADDHRPRRGRPGVRRRPRRGRHRRVHAGRSARARRGRLHRHHGRGRHHHRPGGVAARDLRARLLRRPQGARRGAAAGRGRALAHRGGGDHRHPPHRPGRAAGGRQVGRRDLPAPSHDRAHGHRRVTGRGLRG